MKYVLDASVAVASLRPNEPGHAAAVAYVSPLLRGVDSIAIPAIFRIEVASSLARSGFASAQVSRFVDAFLARARVTSIGPRRAREIQDVAIATRLRAADAIYVWLAEAKGVRLVTLDQEVLQRGSVRCQVVAP